MLAESLPKAAGKSRIQWDSETIYKYNRKIEHILKRLESSKHYGLAESFIVALKLSGVSLGRVYYYSNRLGTIIQLFECKIKILYVACLYEQTIISFLSLHCIDSAMFNRSTF